MPTTLNKFPSDNITLGQIRKAVGPEEYTDNRKLMGAINALLIEEVSVAVNVADEAEGKYGDEGKGLSRTFGDAAKKRLAAAYQQAGVGESEAGLLVQELVRDALAAVPGRKPG